MLRKISFIVAVAAILAIPFSRADARMGGHPGMRMGHVGGLGGWGGHPVSRVSFATRHAVFAPRHVVFAPRHHVFFARRHFVRPFFVAGLYGNPCWRWVPTVIGWQRVWVCGPYPYY